MTYIGKSSLSPFRPCSVRLPFLKSEVFGRRRGVWTDSRARFDGALLWQVPVPEHGPVLKARPYRAAPYASALRLQEDLPTNIPFFFVVYWWAGGCTTFSLSVLSCFLLIGLFPRSLACPIILWNIQGECFHLLPFQLL